MALTVSELLDRYYFARMFSIVIGRLSKKFNGVFVFDVSTMVLVNGTYKSYRDAALSLLFCLGSFLYCLEVYSISR